MVLAGLLTGCTGSVHPLLTEENLLEDSDLSGVWVLEVPDKDNKVQKIPVELDGYDTSTYDLLFSEEWLQDHGKTTTSGPDFPDAWTFQIGKIDNQLYGQLIPRDLPTGPPAAFGIPIYWFGKVTLGDDTVEFTPVRDDWAAVAEREKLPHVNYEPSDFVELTVFTMPTPELQDAVKKHGDVLFKSRSMILRRVKKNKVIKKIENRTKGILSGVRHLTFDPEGKRLAACGIANTRVKAWELGGYQLVIDVYEETGTVDFDPTGKFLASGCGSIITFREAKTGEIDGIISLRSGIAGRVLRVKYSPDGSQLAAQDSTGGVRVYDAESGATQFHFKDGATALFLFHPKTSDLAVIYEKWDEVESRLLHYINFHEHRSGKQKPQPHFDVSLLNRPRDLDFNSDGSRLAVCGVGETEDKGLCLVFDTGTGRLLKRIEGKQDSMRCVKFGSEDRLIATGSEDGSIVLWDAEDGAQVDVLQGHSSTVRSIDFHPDGNTLASGGEDGMIYLWKVTSQEAVR
jgi:hypothetical protein